MSKVTADISMSLDGFITDPNEGGEHPPGDDPGRLHDWMFDAKTETDEAIVDENYASTGAVLIGKRMFDVGFEPWGDPPPAPEAMSASANCASTSRRLLAPSGCGPRQRLSNALVSQFPTRFISAPQIPGQRS